MAGPDERMERCAYIQKKLQTHTKDNSPKKRNEIWAEERVIRSS